MLTVGSLFAGIGGFDYGLERAGMRCLWQCEIDPFAQRVLEKHWPDVLRVPDIRELGADTVEPVDLICGGFPCQDISLAGAGAGIDGERSGLWAEMFRVVRELRPRYVFVENVPALLGRGLDRVLGDLASCGFDAEWDCLPASAFGAPHRRDRFWLVAYPAGEQHQVDPHADGRTPSALLSADADGSRRRAGLADIHAGQPDAQGSGRDVAHAEGDLRRAGLRSDESREGRWGESADSGESRGTVQDTDRSSLQPWRVGGRIAQAGGPEWWAVEPPVGRVAHGVPDRLDQLAALGNAIVPQIAEWIGRRILEWEGVTL